MEPTLVVIGISYRTAALTVRERFWMDEAHKVEALEHLVRSEGVDEVMVVSTCNRTEFYIWTQNASDASSSVLRFLTRAYNLKLSDWSNFYRLVDEPALLQLFRVAASLDTHLFGEPDVAAIIEAAWHLAEQHGTVGRFLNTIVRHAIATARDLRSSVPDMRSVVTIQAATIAQCRDVFVDLQQRSVLVLGAGSMGQSMASAFKAVGVENVTIASRDPKDSEVVGKKLGVRAVSFAGKSEAMKQADILVAATSCPKVLVTRKELDEILADRQNRPMVVIDAGVPRNIEPSVRTLQSVCLFDLDDLCEDLEHSAANTAADMKAEDLVRSEVLRFRRKLERESVIPSVSALREKLDSICEEELLSIAEQLGPFTDDQEIAMRTYSGHLTQRLCSMVARHLTPTPGRRSEQLLEQAILRLFEIAPERSERNVHNG